MPNCRPTGSSSPTRARQRGRNSLGRIVTQRPMPTRESLVEAFHGSAEGLGLSMVYDVAHNLPKIEEYEVDGRVRKLCAVTVSQPELLAEEASYAYKDVSQVVRACEGAAPSRTAAGPHPVEVVKG